MALAGSVAPASYWSISDRFTSVLRWLRLPQVFVREVQERLPIFLVIECLPPRMKYPRRLSTSLPKGGTAFASRPPASRKRYTGSAAFKTSN